MIQSEQENEIFCGVYRFSKWTHEIAEITNTLEEMLNYYVDFLTIRN